jgi:hypothetical protein
LVNVVRRLHTLEPTHITSLPKAGQEKPRLSGDILLIPKVRGDHTVGFSLYNLEKISDVSDMRQEGTSSEEEASPATKRTRPGLICDVEWEDPIMAVNLSREDNLLVVVTLS